MRCSKRQYLKKQNHQRILTSVQLKINEHQRQLLDSGTSITVDTIKNACFGITEKGKTIVEAFWYHNKNMKELLHQQYAEGA